MITDRHLPFPLTSALTAGIDRVTRKADNVYLDGQAMAEGLFGDAMATNNFMVGVAYQAGTIPLKADSIETAIKNSGVGVEQSLAAFRWGRMAVVDRAFVEAEIAKYAPKVAKPEVSGAARQIVDAVGAQGETRRLLEVRVPDLIAYQDEAYAKRYAEVVKRVVAAEQRAVPGRSAVAEAAARYLYKLMAYKDEYEVARLFTQTDFVKKIEGQFEGDYTINMHLAPPLWAKVDPATGEPRKRTYAVDASAMRVLAKMKFLRGSALDVFGYAKERRTERQLIPDYEKTVGELLEKLEAKRIELAAEIAAIPEFIRGYGHVKDRHLADAKSREAQLLDQWRNPGLAAAKRIPIKAAA
jgi:indolepyruvate ferredoxin oxidoreductase